MGNDFFTPEDDAVTYCDGITVYNFGPDTYTDEPTDDEYYNDSPDHHWH